MTFKIAIIEENRSLSFLLKNKIQSVTSWDVDVFNDFKNIEKHYNVVCYSDSLNLNFCGFKTEDVRCFRYDQTKPVGEIFTGLFNSLYINGFNNKYCSIDIDQYLSNPLNGVDLFIRIGENKLIKAVSYDNTNNLDFIRSIKKKGQKEMFVLHEEYTKALTKKIADRSKSPTAGFNVELQKDLDNLSETVLLDVYSKKTEEYTKKILLGCFKDIIKKKKNGAFKKILLNQVKNDSWNFYMACLSIYMLKNLGFQTKGMHESIVMASLFHNITLPYSLKKYHTIEEVIREGSSETDIASYYNYPVKSASFIDKMNLQSTSAPMIIKQHQETPDGRGFPYKLKEANITPLSVIFKIAYDLTHIRRTAPNEDIAASVRKLKPLYSNAPKFLKYIRDGLKA